MNIRKQGLVTVIIVFFSCSEAKKQNEYFSDLGEIRFDEKLDDANFLVCHEDITFPFNYGGVGLVYEGEKRELVRTIRNEYEYPKTNGQDGYITIRFIINCEGKSGRYRIEEMGLDLRPKKFEENISGQIMQIVKGLRGWKAFERNGKTWDYQQYLAFKLKDGQLKEILP